MSKTALYRHFDKAGKLLYVGISCNALIRTDQHENGAEWFTKTTEIKIKHYPTRREARQAEIDAIKKEKPIYNRKDVKRICRDSEGLQNTNGMVRKTLYLDDTLCNAIELEAEKDSRSFNSYVIKLLEAVEITHA